MNGTNIDILVKGVDLEKAEAALRDVEGVNVVADLKIDVERGNLPLFHG